MQPVMILLGIMVDVAGAQGPTEGTLSLQLSSKVLCSMVSRCRGNETLVFAPVNHSNLSTIVLAKSPSLLHAALQSSEIHTFDFKWTHVFVLNSLTLHVSPSSLSLVGRYDDMVLINICCVSQLRRLQQLWRFLFLPADLPEPQGRAVASSLARHSALPTVDASQKSSNF